MIALRTASTRLLRVILPVALGLFLASPSAAEAATFEVNLATDAGDFQLDDRSNACDVSPLDPGRQCTLRAAIQESNATAGADLVTFGIGSPQHTGQIHNLKFSSTLPPLTGPVVIDGYTQAGSSPNTRKPEDGLNTKLRIQIDGADTHRPDLTYGFTVASGGTGSVLKGLSIVNFEDGAVFADTGWVRVEGNFIGMTASGDGEGNFNGIVAYTGGYGDGTVIGGSSPAASNLIHANAGWAIDAGESVIVQRNVFSANGGNVAGGDGFKRAAIYLGESDGSNRILGNYFVDNASSPINVQNGGPDSPTQISRNLMRRNDLGKGLGIDVGGDGVTPNDADEADGVQNAPVLKRVARGSDAVRVTGRLTSRPRDSYRIELFAADGNTRQGKRYLGAVKTRTDRRGRATFAYSTRRIAKGSFVTATASALDTEPVPLTSEFATPRKVR